MKVSVNQVKQWLAGIAETLEKSDVLPKDYYNHFLDDVSVAQIILDIFNSLSEEEISSRNYTVCIFALELILVQLEAKLTNSKTAGRDLDLIMTDLAILIAEHKHSLNFWMPLLNAFYEAKVELSEELKEAYFDLASSYHEDFDKEDNFQALQDLLEDLKDLSVYEVAEYIFAQSYPMPEEFFADLLQDLYLTDNGKESALLLLMHPKATVREIVLREFDTLVSDVELSSKDLYRLSRIKYFYPEDYYPLFDSWIKTQRKKGVVFEATSKAQKFKILASEIDGLGAQGLFLEIKQKNKYKIGGILLKLDYGIKEVWVTPLLSLKDLTQYYKDTASDILVLRAVDNEYLEMIINHFLAVTLELKNFPGLHLLELQELTGINFVPQRIEIDALIDSLAIEICPFTTESLRESLKRTSTWPKTKSFTESWYMESPVIDKLVNASCTYLDGTKVCNFAEAMEKVFNEYFEQNREFWKFHFLWTSLWLKSKAKSSEKSWIDSFYLAYSIKEGVSLKSLPIMQEICYQSVTNSVETMEDRKTYLNL